jgi:hypothetical protein
MPKMDKKPPPKPKAKTPPPDGPLTPAEVKLTEYGYPLSIVRNMAEPEWVAAHLSIHMSEKPKRPASFDQPPPPQATKQQPKPVPPPEPPAPKWTLADF